MERTLDDTGAGFIFRERDRIRPDLGTGTTSGVFYEGLRQLDA